MEFKHEDELRQFENCPPTDATPVDDEVRFRFVFEDIADGRNFLPVAIKNPQREFETLSLIHI